MKDDDAAGPGPQDAALDRDPSHDGEWISEGESLPAPEYSDLLDTAWLTRDADIADLDDDMMDEVGVVLDLAETADDDDVAAALEFDVGSLLTSLAPESFGPWAPQPTDASTALETSRSERERLGGAADESIDDAFAARALHDLLLPESMFPEIALPESMLPDAPLPDAPLPDAPLGDSLVPASLLPVGIADTDRGDDEVGDDERFPVFESVDGAPVSREDDAASDVELD